MSCNDNPWHYGPVVIRCRYAGLTSSIVTADIEWVTCQECLAIAINDVERRLIGSDHDPSDCQSCGGVGFIGGEDRWRGCGDCGGSGKTC